MQPEELLRRTQKTLLGLSCIAGGCAALVWLMSTSRLERVFAALESTASAAEENALAEAPLPPGPVRAPGRSLNDKALINDLHITDSASKPDVTLERVIIPPGRPEWVEADFSQQQSETQKVAVSSGPFKRKHDASRALDEELVRATEQFVTDYLGSRAAGKLVPVDLGTIRRELLGSGDVYHEQIVVYDIGPMFQSHALLQFTPHFKQRLDERWRSIVVAGRVARLGVIAVAVLVMLSVVLGYFKADTATRGYYTTRLQVGSAAVILAVVAGGVMLFRML